MPSCAPQAARSPRAPPSIWTARCGSSPTRATTCGSFCTPCVRRGSTDGVQTDFVHCLRLVDGIYPAEAITPYRDLTAALRADDLLQVKAVRYETVTRELPFETQTIEDAGLDFGKTETVQAGQNGSELVTSEITTVAGEVVSTRVVDVQLVQASVPEVIHRGTRLKSGMIGRLGTGSFLWPVPGYSASAGGPVCPMDTAAWTSRPPTARRSMPPTRARSLPPSGTTTLP